MSIYAEEDFINAFMDTAHMWANIDKVVSTLAMTLENSVDEGIASAENEFQMDAPSGSKQEMFRCALKLLKELLKERTQ